jgi:16S rRNA (guanine527-N7)-methyltransferase
MDRPAGRYRRAVAIDVTPQRTALLERYAALVAASPHNLVSRSARADLLGRHIPEAVALADLLPAAAGRLLDLGSGGGLPGLVIAIVRPDLDVHLLDATSKKTAFLRDTCDALGLQTSVHTGRAEDLATSPLAGTFDVVTARAVAPLERLLPWALPFLRPDGVLYAVKGERWAAELEEATPVLARLGGRVMATPDDTLTAAPDADGSAYAPRVVIIGRRA